MTDSVACTQDSSHVFTCHAALDTELNVPEPPVESPPPSRSAERPASESVVSTLVERYTRTIPPQSAPYFTAEAVMNCASSGIGVVLAAIANKGPALGALIAFKAGYDIAKCVADEHDHASQAATTRKVREICAAAGGEVTAVLGDKSTCEVRAKGR